MLAISLAAARVNANMTLTEAAQELGITECELAKWEQNAEDMTFRQAMAIRKLYGIPLENIDFMRKGDV